ncbi:MAG: hypothetical protein GY862_18355 [Gammaproteobacteria bacterium]|nr:hypothetical protein [Gammaproteobacteria bacterium]
MRIIGRIGFLLLSLLVWMPNVSASPQETLQQAIAAYSKAQETKERESRVEGFRQAERLFDSAARQGVYNADLQANLGAAALQAERLGPAVLAFRRALHLDPDHGRALQNLAHARTLLPAWVPRPAREGVLDSFFFWHRSLSVNERAAAAAICFLIAALGFAAAIRWRNGIVRNLALLPALVWIGLTASLAVEAYSPSARQAVVIVDEALARAADSANAPARFAEPLPGGTEVDILENREEWVRIKLANSRDAWVRRGTLAMVEENLL